jgi:hypothetical protein
MTKVLRPLYVLIFDIFAKVPKVLRRCPPCSSSYNYLLLKREIERERAKVLTCVGAYARAREEARHCGRWTSR